MFDNIFNDSLSKMIRDMNRRNQQFTTLHSAIGTVNQNTALSSHIIEMRRHFRNMYQLPEYQRRMLETIQPFFEMKRILSSFKDRHTPLYKGIVDRVDDDVYEHIREASERIYEESYSEEMNQKISEDESSKTTINNYYLGPVTILNQAVSETEERVTNEGTEEEQGKWKKLKGNMEGLQGVLMTFAFFDTSTIKDTVVVKALEGLCEFIMNYSNF
ncbi:hypothetical protein ABD68_06385 [Bacillus endophyticus]|uniref:hypothetical protein n=1 Tax=Priestia endophytica TaxID=135735 RepID=UPI0018CC7F49|nr:hypothetical protein [Priestia endophytica]MBG9811240.1 hypothetical protein [Priestia endophytica]